MKKILYYDCFCGISGDMNLAALLDLGIDERFLKKELSKLNVDEEFELKVQKKVKNGIEGNKVDVILKNKNHHTHDQNKDSYHHNRHRNLFDIEKIIDSSDLNENIKSISKEIFKEIAKAESKVHGKSIEEVHFHEVGATDSIVDIVGAAICIDYLKVDKIISSTIQLGGGFVKCAHGKIPIPAPATIEILKEIPIKTGLVEFETTTPTGAAILKATAKEFTDKQNFKIKKTGYGVGYYDFEIPNVLRVYLGEESSQISDEVSIEKQFIIETNIDDMNPELLPHVEKLLFEAGALDVSKIPINMKKGRLAAKLNIMIKPEIESKILKILFTETTTIGVRRYKIDKITLNREFDKINTKYGEVTVKKSYYNGKIVNSKAEFEDCQKIALENNIPIKVIYEEINKLISEKNE